MDFITDLPTFQEFDSILVVVDQLTKMAHFVTCIKDINAEQTAQLVLRKVIQLHRIPKDITSDREPQFASKFWSHLFHLLGTKINLSSAYHPQLDRQSERVNQADLLPLAKFVYNNLVHASTKFTPFFANYGFHSHFDLQTPFHSSVPLVEDKATHLLQIKETLISKLKVAQDYYKSNANRKCLESPNFKVEIINPVAYHLTLPPTSKLHNIFHVSLLEPYITNSFPGRSLEPPPSITFENTTDMNYDINERFWEPVENVANAQEAVEVFYQRYPDKPGQRKSKHKAKSSKEGPLRGRWCNNQAPNLQAYETAMSFNISSNTTIEQQDNNENNSENNDKRDGKTDSKNNVDEEDMNKNKSRLVYSDYYEESKDLMIIQDWS
ncbi:20059_t:CDS:2 [Dentiscutata erythropus]|uniref:20059_t:CDS:1 n=1 Tax=Dentiscutata erythropus TaxID=1348616 RepID=A0A9N9G621_9GLOM|nr:20059_t:CDS:2 [Dentiscutata erythropus]